MEQRPRNKRNRKQKTNSSRQKWPPARLSKVLNPLATYSNIVCRDNFSISTKAGSADVVFSHNNEKYSNFNRLFTLDDFSDASGMYQYVKLNSITVEITRAVDEATITSALAGSALFINQYPTVQGIAPSYALISASDSSYKIDTLTFSKQ
jgi:hypothetical protein